MKTWIVGVALGLALGSPAWACRCAEAKDARAQLARGDLMFVGRADRTDGTGQDAATTHFTVFRTLKGPRLEHVSVVHPTSGATCGIRFPGGQTYAVIARRRRDGAWVTTECDAPRFPMSDFERALKGR